MFKTKDSPLSLETRDSRMPARSKLVTRYLIDRWAEERPEKVFAKFDGIFDRRKVLYQHHCGTASLPVRVERVIQHSCLLQVGRELVVDERRQKAGNVML